MPNPNFGGDSSNPFANIPGMADVARLMQTGTHKLQVPKRYAKRQGSLKGVYFDPCSNLEDAYWSCFWKNSWQPEECIMHKVKLEKCEVFKKKLWKTTKAAKFYMKDAFKRNVKTIGRP